MKWWRDRTKPNPEKYEAAVAEGRAAAAPLVARADAIEKEARRRQLLRWTDTDLRGVAR